MFPPRQRPHRERAPARARRPHPRVRIPPSCPVGPHALRLLEVPRPAPPYEFASPSSGPRALLIERRHDRCRARIALRRGRDDPMGRPARAPRRSLPSCGGGECNPPPANVFPGPAAQAAARDPVTVAGTSVQGELARAHDRPASCSRLGPSRPVDDAASPDHR